MSTRAWFVVTPLHTSCLALPIDLPSRLKRVTARPSISPDYAPQPVLLVSASDSSVEPAEILKQIQRFHKEDDVFDEAFVSDTLLVADDFPMTDQMMLLRTELADEIVLDGKRWHLNSVYGVDTSISDADIPSGPYFLSGDRVFQAWKIYTDVFSCFEITVLPTKLPYRWVNWPKQAGEAPTERVLTRN